MSDTVEVLIVADLHDFPTDRVCLALRRRGVRFARLNRETLPQARIRLNPITPCLDVELDGVIWRVTDDLRAVYWRQPTFLRNTPGVALTLDQQLERSQWSALLRSLTLFQNARWVNDLASTYRAESKPFQLRTAAGLGLPTPRTMITNDAAAQGPLMSGGAVVVKPVDTVLLREGDIQHFAYATILPWADVANPDLSQVPVIVQEPIEPKTDIRVTIVGEQLWAVQIVADGRGVAGDWRLQKKADLRYEDIELPALVKDQCFALMSALGLSFAGIDLARRGEEFVFIEINPTGEWGWLDGPHRPIAQAIAALLSS